MPQDPTPPPSAPVIILVTQDAIPADDEATRDFIDLLESLGATELNADRLPTFGIITGAIPEDRLDEFRALPGIDDIEPDQTMHLLDDEETE